MLLGTITRDIVFIAAECLVFGRSAEFVRKSCGIVSIHLLDLETTELIVYNVPYYLIGSHGD